MANLESLNVQFIGEAKSLITAVAKSEKSLESLAVTAEKSSSSITKSLASTAVAASKVDSSLGTYSKASGAATQATINLSRVLQDAPFGFIGIANNLNPLLESFGSLGKQAGGLKGALSALGSSILGAGGIGLALSAFQFFALGGVDAIKKMFGALGDNKAVAEARKEMDDFNKSLKDAEAGALSTGLKLQSFVDIAKNGALPLSQRNEALKEANKILGKHGTKLTLANVATEAITKQTEMFTKALIAQAVAAKFADRIADLSVKQAEIDKRRTKELVELNKEIKKNNELQNQATGGGGSTGGAGGLGNVSAFQKATAAQDRYNATLRESTSLALELNSLTGSFKQATLAGTQLFGALGTNSDKVSKTGKERISDIVAKFRKEIAALNVLNQKGFIDSFELDKKSVDEYQKAIQDIAKINKNAIEITDLSIEIQPTILAMAVKKYRDNIGKLDLGIIPAFAQIAPVIGKSGFDFASVMAAQYKKAGEVALAQSQALAAIVYNSTLEAFTGLGDAISAGLSGANFGASLFSGLFQTLGAGLQAYGKQVIVASKLLIALQKVLPAGNFAGSLFVGIGLVALGGLTKNLGASLKLADGGFVSGKGSSRSDSIPAMLSNGEYVINAAAVRKFGLNNLDKINSLQGFAAGGVIGVPQPYAVPNNNVSIDRGDNMVIMGETVLRGQDIYVLYNRAAKQAGRNS